MKLDFLFVNDFSDIGFTNSLYLGQLNLYNIVKNDGRFSSLLFNPYEMGLKNMFLSKKRKDYILHVVNLIKDLNPTIVGFYTICYTFEITIEIAYLLKKNNPNMIIIFAGPQATLMSEECLTCFDFIDGISLGEGENSILETIEILLNKGDWGLIPNFCYKSSENLIVKNEVKSLLSSKEIENTLIKDYSPFKIENTKLYIEGGRGCPYNCTFCTTSSFWKRIYRVCTAEALIKAIEYYYKYFNIKQYSIIHDLFTVNKKNLNKFCRLIKFKNLKISWSCSSRTDVLSEEIIKNMSESGCENIYFGIESGSSSFQKSINKHLNLTQSLKIIETCAKNKIEPTCSFIFGFPDEKENDLLDTLKMITELYFMDIFNIQLHLFTPFPKTKETKKIIDKAYFDPKGRNLSLGEVYNFTDYGLNIIKTNKEIFISYYTFDTLVRKKYKYLDILIESFGVSKDLFRFEIKKVLKKISLKDIYLKYEKEIIFSYNLICNLTIANTEDVNRILYNLTFLILNKEINLLNKNEKKVFSIHSIALDMLNRDEFEEKYILCDFDYKEMTNHNFEVATKNIIHLYYDGELSMFCYEQKRFFEEIVNTQKDD